MEVFDASLSMAGIFRHWILCNIDQAAAEQCWLTILGEEHEFQIAHLERPCAPAQT